MSLNYVYSVQTGSVAISASATKSMWLISPVTNPITIAEIGVTLDAASFTTAARVDLYVVTTLGSPAGTTATVVKWSDQSEPSATTTGLTALSAEPTTVAILASWFLQPTGLVIQYPLDREPGTAAAATTNRLGLRIVTPSGTSGNAVSYVAFTEG